MNPCIIKLRNKGEAKCNGGGYDGCACGPYSPKDLLRLQTLKERTA